MAPPASSTPRRANCAGSAVRFSSSRSSVSAGEQRVQLGRLHRIAAAVRQAPFVAVLGDRQRLALMLDLDPRRVLQLRREIREHQPAGGDGLALGRLAGRAEIPAARQHDQAGDQQGEPGARPHARAPARIALSRARVRRRRRDDAEHDREDGQQRGHQHDAEQLHFRLQRGDVAVEVELHVAQLLARGEHVGTRRVDRCALLLGDDRIGALRTRRAAALAQLAELFLRVVEVLLQRALALAELASARFCIALTTSNGRRLGPRLRRPISASPPASVPIRLATNGPLSLNGVACSWPKKSCVRTQ